jgi:hypothetical protein
MKPDADQRLDGLKGRAMIAQDEVLGKHSKKGVVAL